MLGRKMESRSSVWKLTTPGITAQSSRGASKEIDDVLAIYKAMVDLRKHTDGGLKRLKRFDKFFDQHRELLRKDSAVLGTQDLAA